MLHIINAALLTPFTNNPIGFCVVYGKYACKLKTLLLKECFFVAKVENPSF